MIRNKGSKRVLGAEASKPEGVIRPSLVRKIPSEERPHIYDYLRCFQNCYFCKGIFYHTPRKPQYSSIEPFVCVHCSCERAEASEEQGIYLSRKLIKDGTFPYNWWVKCSCCRTNFFVDKEPTKKAYTTAIHSSATGKAIKRSVKDRGAEHFCERCAGKSPADFGAKFTMTPKMAENMMRKK